MSQRPNILLITTDQQRFDTIHAAGNPHIRTPHLNWLCARGIRFSRCYSDAPSCIPARTTLMTGRTGYRNNVIANAASVRPIDPARSLPGLLTHAGYQTRAVGKMHFVPPRCNYGFEHMELLEDYYRHMARHPEYGVPTDHGVAQNEMEPVVSTVHESHSLTHWTVDRSIDFLETRDTSRPFFLWTSFSKPHPPFDPCANYWLQYQNAEVPAPVYGDWSTGADQMPLALRWGTCAANGCEDFSPELLRDMRRAYYACITQIDYNLGCLFARLRELELLDNTWILFTSDHGEMLGDHHLGAKGVFLEGSAHVPLLLRTPETDKGNRGCGTVCQELTSLTDIYATCMAAAEVKVPQDYPIDGRDLRQVAAGEAHRDALVGVGGKQGTYRQMFCLIRGMLKYLYCAGGARELLFDLSKDPYEQHNLSGNPALQGVMRQMKQELLAELAAMRPEYLQDGQLPVYSEPDLTELRATWPGFHSRYGGPDDVVH